MKDPKEGKPSIGEEYLLDFFKEVGIKCIPQQEIRDLKGDEKSYRIADFYLPDYKMYVEFFGQWSLPDRCIEYRKKMSVYKFNNIPCVYLFPENLGIIKYVFDKRIQIELFNRNLHKELIKYRRDKLMSSGEFQLRMATILFCIFMIVDKGIFPKHLNIGEILLLSTIALVGIYQIFYTIKLYRRIFRGNKFTLDQLDFDFF
jgi:hypothetical protein